MPGRMQIHLPRRLSERMPGWMTEHTHTHTYIYIDIDVSMCTCPGHFCNTRRHFVATRAQWTMPSSKRRVSCWANHFVRARFGPLFFNMTSFHSTVFVELEKMQRVRVQPHVCLKIWKLVFLQNGLGLNTTAHRRSRWNKRCYKIDWLKKLCLDVFSVDVFVAPMVFQKNVSEIVKRIAVFAQGNGIGTQ